MSTTEPIAVRADPPAVLELPPAHLELSWRPLQPGDVSALHALIQVIEEADQAHECHSHPEVAELLRGEWKDLKRDTLAGFDEQGVMRGYALVELRPDDTRVLRAQLYGGVHPQWRGRGIGRAALAWAEGRGRQKLAASGKDLPARLAVTVEEQARDQRRLYAAAGFSPIRWHANLRRDLRQPLPPIEPPPGLRVLHWRAELDEQVRLAHNEVFAEHWGTEPLSTESWLRQEPHFTPEWTWVAQGRDGLVVGYLLSARYEQDWPTLGYSFGHTLAVGVRPAWRGRGLGAALLVTAMNGYRASGMEYACLRVDTANASGAYGLYQRLGYEPTHGYVTYSVEI